MDVLLFPQHLVVEPFIYFLSYISWLLIVSKRVSSNLPNLISTFYLSKKADFPLTDSTSTADRSLEPVCCASNDTLAEYCSTNEVVICVDILHSPYG